MRKALILISVLFVIFLFSGCVEQETITPDYDDEALKMETEVTGKVLPSQAINLKVHLINQVPDDVREVRLEITDLYGLEVRSKTCSGTPLTVCELGDISSLDDIEVNYVLRVPTKEELARIGRELKPELTLEYTYSGETTFLIPIIGPNERGTSAKSQLIQTKGPIHVDIERGFTSSSAEWERSGSGFSVIIRVRDVLTSEPNVIIDKDNFLISLNDYLLIDEELGRCDFNSTTAPYRPLDDIDLPMQTPLVCALSGNSQGMPWVYGQVTVNYYDYNYEAVKTESIMVETVIV